MKNEELLFFILTSNCELRTSNLTPSSPPPPSRSAAQRIPRTRPSRRRPLLELGDELLVRDRDRCAVASRVPAPQHQFVFVDVLDQRREILTAVFPRVLDHGAA